MRKPLSNHLTCDQCIILLMLNRNDYSFGWYRYKNDIEILQEYGLIVWDACTTVKITPLGYKRIEIMLQ